MKNRFIAMLIILGSAFMIYSNSLQNEFTNWDDESLIVENRAIRSLKWKNLKTVLIPRRGATFQPVRVISYAIDYHFWKLNPVGYHLHNILLHGMAGFLLYLSLLHALPQIRIAARGSGEGVSRREEGMKSPKKSRKRNIADKKKKRKTDTNTIAGHAELLSADAKPETLNQQDCMLIAGITALLFIVHPVCVESVTWMASRKYTLLAFFSFLSFYMFIKASKKGSYNFYYSFISFVAALLAVLSSPFGIVLPALFFLFDFCRAPINNPIRIIVRQKLHYIPYALLLLLFVPILWKALVAGESGGADKAHYMGNPVYTLLTMFRVIFDYIRNFLCPLWLNVRYVDYVSFSLFESKVMISLILLIVLSVRTVIQVAGGNKMTLFCLGWFFITWSPVSNIIPISTKMADRYVYLSSVGFFLWVAYAFKTGLMPVVFRMMPFKGNLHKKIVISLSISILLPYAVGTFNRNKVWLNSVTLWQDSLQKDSGNYLAQTSLGNAFTREGEFDQAIHHYTTSIALYPNNMKTRNNLGSVFLKLNRPEEARVQLEAAVAINPNFLELHYNLGIALAALGRYEDAIEEFHRELRINPNHSGCYSGLGHALLKMGRYDESVESYDKFLKHNPDNAEAHYNLALALLGKKDLEKARTHLFAALKLNTNYAQAFNTFGTLFHQLGDMDKAIENYRKALKSEPNFAEAHQNLGSAFMDQGAVGKAIHHFKKALTIKPDWPEAINYLAWVLATHEDPNVRNALDAVRLAERALSLVGSDNVSILDTLGAAYAAAGRYAEALDVSNKALHIAKNGHHSKLAGAIKKRIKLYEDHNSYIQVEQ